MICMGDKISAKGSILLTAPISPSAEEQLYRAVFDFSKSTGVQGIVWVCYQRTPGEVEKRLDAYGISFANLRFIDMISHVMGLKQESKNTTYCTSPTDYSCLSRVVDEKLDSMSKCLVIIDSINAMMSYDQEERFIKALRSFNNRIPQKNSSVLYTCIAGACDRQTEVAIQTTMDYVLPVGGKVKGKKDIEWESFKGTSWQEVLSLKAPVLFAMVIVMFAVMIFISSLLIYLMLKFY